MSCLFWSHVQSNNVEFTFCLKQNLHRGLDSKSMVALNSTVLQWCRDKQRRPGNLSTTLALMGQKRPWSSLWHSSPMLLDSVIYFLLEGTLESLWCTGGSRTSRRWTRASLKVSKVGDLKIDTLDPFPCHAGPWVWSEFPWGQCSGFEAESSALSSHEVYNSIFIAFLSNKVYGTSGTHSVKNADSLYEFLMGEEEQGRPQGELVKC